MTGSAGDPPPHLRAATTADIASLTALTVRTFGPFYEGSFRALVGPEAQRAFHGDWREDYVRMVPDMVDGGGDAFHHLAMGLYESLGCTLLPVSVYYRDL